MGFVSDNVFIFSNTVKWSAIGFTNIYLKILNLASDLTNQEQGSVADAVEALKDIDFNLLLLADEADISISFAPIPHDGVFFQG